MKREKITLTSKDIELPRGIKSIQLSFEPNMDRMVEALKVVLNSQPQINKEDEKEVS